MHRFQTLGSSLGKPGALTSASTLPAVPTAGSSAVTPVGCPVDILSAVEIFVSQRRIDTIFGEPTPNIQTLQDALHLIRSYDIPTSMKSTIGYNSAVSHGDLFHLGTIWKLAADIYTCHGLFSLIDRAPVVSESPSVHSLRAEYSFLERNDDGILKCLI